MPSAPEGAFGQGDESELLDGLLRFTIGVLDARRVDEIADVVTEVAVPLIGAANATVAVLEPSREVLRVYRGPDASPGIRSVRRVGLDESTPMTDAIMVMLHESVPGLNRRDALRIAANARYFASAQFWARMRTGFDMSGDQTFEAFESAMAQVLPRETKASRAA